jgi:hypothetical protein
MQSTAKSIEAYLEEIPRIEKMLSKLRETIYKRIFRMDLLNKCPTA